MDYDMLMFKGLVTFIIDDILKAAIAVCCILIITAFVKSRRLAEVKAEVFPHRIKTSKGKKLVYDSISYSYNGLLCSEMLLPKRYKDKFKDTVTVYINTRKPQKFYMHRFFVVKPFAITLVALMLLLCINYLYINKLAEVAAFFEESKNQVWTLE